MEAYKCDRCGNYYEVENNKSFSYLIRKKRDSGQSTTIDLCEKCKKEFLTWIESTGKTSSDIVEESKPFKAYDTNTKLVDVIDIEKLVTLVWPENLSHRARLRNVLKEKTFTLGDICLETNPKGIGKETWGKVKDYILRSKEVWR